MPPTQNPATFSIGKLAKELLSKLKPSSPLEDISPPKGWCCNQSSTTLSFWYVLPSDPAKPKSEAEEQALILSVLKQKHTSDVRVEFEHMPLPSIGICVRVTGTDDSRQECLAMVQHLNSVLEELLGDREV